MGTIFMFCSDEMLSVVQESLVLSGFQVKLSREPGLDPTASWVGPDCKRLMANAGKYLPHLLHLAHAPANAGPAARAALEEAKKSAPPATEDSEEDDGSDVDDADLDYIPSVEEVAAETKATPLLMKCAKAWDTFFILADYEARIFNEDTDEYREARMVSYFNAEVAVKRALNELGVSQKSFGSHIGMCILTRQILEDGDPGKFSCEPNESFGAQVKQIIHNLCCRSHPATPQTTPPRPTPPHPTPPHSAPPPCNVPHPPPPPNLHPDPP